MTVTTADTIDPGVAADPHARPAYRPFPGPASKRIVIGYGFWIFLLSDFIMFSAFFAAYAVLSGETAGGPNGKQLFDLVTVAIETGALLASSFTCGMSALAVQTRQTGKVYAASFFTFLFGATFLGLEINEFAHMVAEGAGPQRSAFLSSFFSVVGLHGIHVTIGLVWLLVMLAQIATRGYIPNTMRRFLCFALFWHALDIIWVALFTVVYLMGAAA
jgi:cytochrome o ubiquinol oxidase subunit 3